MNVLDVETKAFHEVNYRTSGRNGHIRTVTLPFHRVYVDKLPGDCTSLCAMADLQGREVSTSNRLVGEYVAEELSVLVERGHLPAIDLILLTGDFFDYPDLKKLGGTGDVTSVYIKFSELFDSVVGVYGNHDEIEESMLPENCTVLDIQSLDISGVRVGGVSGIVGNPKRHMRKQQGEFVKAVEKVLKQKIDLLIAHQGPSGEEEEERGDFLLRESLATGGETLYIFGHCHWKTFHRTLGQNHLLNVDNRVLVISEK